MGWLDKLAGKPQGPRQASSRHDDRRNERAAMRASQSTTSPTGSWTHQRSSRQLSRRTSASHQPSPGTSPRSHEHGVSDKWKAALGMMGGHAQQGGHGSQGGTAYAYATQPRPVEQHGVSMPQGGSQRLASSGVLQPPTQQMYNQQHADQVRELQQRLHLQDAQLQEVEGLKQRLLAEQRGGQEWREKWNLQNFKLNLLVDMLVLQAVEQPHSQTSSRPAAGQLSPGTAPTYLSSSSGKQAGAAGVSAGHGLVMAGVGRAAMGRRDDEIMAEDIEGY